MTLYKNATYVDVTKSADDTTEQSQWNTIAGLLVFVLTLPCLLFQWRAVPLGATVTALLGAALMLATNVVTLPELYDVLGREQYSRCILLLIPVMLFAHYLIRDEMLMTYLLGNIIKPGYSFTNYIWRVSLITCLCAAMFTADATCVGLTPIILRLWETHERCRKELPTIVLAITTSASIGSAMSIFGSAHAVLIASTTSLDAYSESRLGLVQCFSFLLPCVAVVLPLNILALVLHYKLRASGIKHSQTELSVSLHLSRNQQEMTNLTNNSSATHTHAINNGHVNGVADGDDDDVTNGDPQEALCGSGGGEREDVGSGAGGYRDTNTPPCTLETIPEDDILEITSDGPSGRSLTSLRALSGADVSCDLSAIDTCHEYDSVEDIDQSEEDIHVSREQSTECLSAHDVTYTPNALSHSRKSSGDLSLHSKQSRSSRQQMAAMDYTNRYGLLLCKRLGVYRCFGGVSAVDFICPQYIELTDIGLSGRTPSMVFPGQCLMLSPVTCVLMVAFELSSYSNVGGEYM